jgi:hypothetical protein
MKVIVLLALLLPWPAKASIFGEENVPLWKLVVGQLAELEKLSAALGVARDSRELLLRVNEGIGRVTEQLGKIDEMVKRAKNIDPNQLKRISDINRLLKDTNALRTDLEALVEAKLLTTAEAIEASSIQGETAYSVGQSIVEQGAKLSTEVKTASPGRATQIAATAEISQMMAVGTLLQTVSQLAQLQAISLDLERSREDAALKDEKARRKAASEFLNRRSKR